MGNRVERFLEGVLADRENPDQQKKDEEDEEPFLAQPKGRTTAQSKGAEPQQRASYASK